MAQANRIPTFVEIIQPEYRWEELQTAETKGVTQLPIEKGDDKATIHVPADVDNPMGRVVRIHELMHARFSPELMSEAPKLVERHGNEVLQIAEDVRLAAIAKERGLYAEDVYWPDLMLQSLAAEFQPGDQTTLGLFYMAAYGQPLEGGATDFAASEFFQRASTPTGARGGTAMGNVLRPSKATSAALDAWRGRVSKITACKASNKEKQRQLASITELALQEIKMQPPPPSMPTGGKGEGKPGQGGEGEPKDGGGQGLGNRDKFDEMMEKLTKDAMDRSMAAQKSKAKSSEQKKALRRQLRRGAPSVKDMKLGEKFDKVMPGRIGADKLNEIMAKWRKSDAARRGRVKKKIPAGAFPQPTVIKVRGEELLGGSIGPAPEPGDENFVIIKCDSEVWGNMNTVTAPLLRHYRATTKREGSAAPDGSVPLYWGRWYTDRSVWDRKGLRRGGTLLIDISGSMSWAHNITAELIEAMPAMTIAAYSSDDGAAKPYAKKYQEIYAAHKGNPSHPAVVAAHAEYMKNAHWGRLTIIAKQGRIVESGQKWREGHGGGNVVDGPALEWLAKQQRPRVWFSDGQVVGVGGQGAYHHKDAARICRLGNIKRTVKVEEVKALFKGKPVAHTPINPPGWDEDDYE